MTGAFTFKAYQRELAKVERQLTALRPAAEALKMKVSLERAIAGILKAQSEARYTEATR